MNNYFICTRNIEGNAFGTNPGATNYLVLPYGNVNPADYNLSKKVSADDFIKTLNPTNVAKDVIIFVHGYNNGIADVLDRHNALKTGLMKAGYQGELISFDWPSSSQALMYLPDRHDAKKTALELVNGGIKLLAQQQMKGCKLNLHAIAHSTGAYIIREAFDDAQTTEGAADVSWTLSQILFIAGDVSSDSMMTHDAASIYAHCNRFTNYYNHYDEILGISNMKRLGFKNRAGRIGLPDDVPAKAVSVDCSSYYNDYGQNLLILNGAKSHSWFFYSDVWFKDACYTLSGAMDRNVIPTRAKINGVLSLVRK